MKLKKGDQIKVMIGKDRGRRGAVERVLPKEDKVLVTNINVYKKHLKAKGGGKGGGIVEITRPLLANKLALICPKCKQITRIGFQLDKTDHKKRICRKCQQIVDE